MTRLKLGSLIRAVKSRDLVVTPRLNVWLLGHPELTLSDATLKRLHDAIEGIRNPRDRSDSFGSSSAGSCLRAQVFEYLGTDQGGIDPKLQQIYNDGKFRHLRWQATLLEAGILDDIEVPLAWPDRRSVGTMDGVGTVPTDHPREEWRHLEFGFELKGANTFTYKTIVAEGPLRYLSQVHRYFLSGGYDLFAIVVEDKNSQDWTEWVIEPDPELLVEQRAELDVLNRAVDTETLPSMLVTCRKQVGEVFRNCSFGGRHGPCVAATRWPV